MALPKKYHLLIHDNLTNEHGEPLTTVAFGANADHLLGRGWQLVDLDNPPILEREPELDPDPDPVEENQHG